MIRFAVDVDGPAIGKLFREADLPDLGVDWHAKIRGWLVAEEDGEIVGAIQVSAGAPFGFIGDIVVARRVRGQGREGRGRLGARPGQVGFSLYVLAFDYLKQLGAQVVLGIADNPALKKMLIRYGGKPLGEFTLFARDLTDWPAL